jgi:hydrogenase maturation factor HypF (carbamoyltransferase family)
VIGCDLYPCYMISHLVDEISQERGFTIVTSQYHHSHIAYMFVKNNVAPDQPIVRVPRESNLARIGLFSNKKP